jgi:hypothetical protein
MWLIILSDQLPIVALVSRYPTNKLIGRGPILRRSIFRLPAVSGISSSFPELFRTGGYVPTRYSPVRHSRIATSVRLACVKPAASVRSEPGSNSQVQLRSQSRQVTKRPNPKWPGLLIDEFQTHPLQKNPKQKPASPAFRRPALSQSAMNRLKRDRRWSLQRSPARQRSSQPTPAKPQTAQKPLTQGQRRPRLSSFRCNCQTAGGQETRLAPGADPLGHGLQLRGDSARQAQIRAPNRKSFARAKPERPTTLFPRLSAGGECSQSSRYRPRGAPQQQRAAPFGTADIGPRHFRVNGPGRRNSRLWISPSVRVAKRAFSCRRAA